MTNELAIDDLRFEIRHSSDRRTLQITVEPDGRLLMLAPDDTAVELMEKFVRDKRRWVYEKLEKQRRLPSTPVQRRYVDGEGFPYLGRNYRLRLIDEQEVPLKLTQGRFCLSRAAVPDAPQAFQRWYSKHAVPWLRKGVAAHAGRVGVSVPDIRVLDLKRRWGSCAKNGTLNFHWRTILLPPQLIEYVVVHELVHLRHPHHDHAFWRMLAAVMPDYERRKERLAVEGARLPKL